MSHVPLLRCAVFLELRESVVLNLPSMCLSLVQRPSSGLTAHPLSCVMVLNLQTAMLGLCASRRSTPGKGLHECTNRCKANVLGTIFEDMLYPKYPQMVVYHWPVLLHSRSKHFSFI